MVRVGPGWLFQRTIHFQQHVPCSIGNFSKLASRSGTARATEGGGEL